MKIIIFILVITNIFASEGGLIASFNTLHLGWKGKSYYKQAEVLKDFDIVALQEVMKQDGLKRLVKELERVSGEEWLYHMSKEGLGRSNRYREHYAFIYKKEKVQFIKSLGTYKELNDEFIREPYGAMFKINNFDFVLVNNHSIFGDRKADRQGEALELLNVYEYFQNLAGDEKDIILLGDFNLPAYDDSFADLFKSSYEIFYAIDPTNLTTVGKSSLSSSYDNIFYSYLYTKEYTGRNGVLDFTSFDKYIEKYGDDRFLVLRKELSDHLPVYIEVDTSYDDD